MKSSRYEPIGIPANAKIVHVFFTGENHETSGKPCWCEPEYQDYSDEDGGIVVSHNRRQ